MTEGKKKPNHLWSNIIVIIVTIDCFFGSCFVANIPPIRWLAEKIIILAEDFRE